MKVLEPVLVYECNSYRQFLHQALAESKDPLVRKPKGSLVRFAKHLQCHPSFIAQVLSERSHLSVDQMMLACDYFQLGESERDQLIDLLLLERAGTSMAKAHFQKRIEQRVQARHDLGRRWKVTTELSEAENLIFFSSWLHQIVFSILHISRLATPLAIASVLQMPSGRIEEVLKTLESLKLVEKQGKKFKALRNWLHLTKSSPAFRVHHQTWRLKFIEEIHRQPNPSGLHYSGALTLSERDAQKLREELFAVLDRARHLVGQSEAETCHALGIDFFPIFPSAQGT